MRDPVLGRWIVRASWAILGTVAAILGLLLSRDRRRDEIEAQWWRINGPGG